MAMENFQAGMIGFFKRYLLEIFPGDLPFPDGCVAMYWYRGAPLLDGVETIVPGL